MLTEDQVKWINHLSATNKTIITPYNPKSKILFKKQKTELHKILGKDITIVHRGASNLGISGKGELDIYIPVPVDKFDELLAKLIHAYGEPGSLYSLERARFNRKVDGVIAALLMKKPKDGNKDLCLRNTYDHILMSCNGMNG